MDESQFYTYRDGSKVELCKKCLTMHIDNFNPDTYAIGKNGCTLCPFRME